MITYLTGVSIDLTRESSRPDLGFITTPESDRFARQCNFYKSFAADNGCFNTSKPGRKFDPSKWLGWLDKVPRDCLFATLPDILNWKQLKPFTPLVPVGDWQATLRQSEKYFKQVKGMGFETAIVLQDGARDLDEIYFPVDAVFVGGSDMFKLGDSAAHICKQARERGLWAHMGRVNSERRLRYAESIGCHSADGTFLKFCSKADQYKQFSRMTGWLDRVNGLPPSMAVAV